MSQVSVAWRQRLSVQIDRLGEEWAGLTVLFLCSKHTPQLVQRGRDLLSVPIRLFAQYRQRLAQKPLSLLVVTFCSEQSSHVTAIDRGLITLGSKQPEVDLECFAKERFGGAQVPSSFEQDSEIVRALSDLGMDVSKTLAADRE